MDLQTKICESRTACEPNRTMRPSLNQKPVDPRSIKLRKFSKSKYRLDLECRCGKQSLAANRIRIWIFRTPYIPSSLSVVYRSIRIALNLEHAWVHEERQENLEKKKDLTITVLENYNLKFQNPWVQSYQCHY